LFLFQQVFNLAAGFFIVTLELFKVSSALLLLVEPFHHGLIHLFGVLYVEFGRLLL